MSTVISNDKHYKKIAGIIRRSQTDDSKRYFPSEMPQAIASTMDVYNATESGAFSDKEDNITIIGSKMCPGLFAESQIKTFEIPQDITEIPNYAFYHAERLESIVMHDNVVSIGDHAFYYCESLTSITLPTNLVHIGDSAFSSSGLIGKLIIPASVTTIDANGFSYTKYTSIDIYSNDLVILYYAFSNSNNLEAVILRNESKVIPLDDDFAAETAFRNTPIASGTGYIYVPASLVDAYKADSLWSTYASQIRAIEDYPDICG